MMQEYRTKELYGDFYENEGKPLVVIIGGRSLRVSQSSSFYGAIS